ncbi:GPR137B isoform 1 [Pan troglodytes]|uniref:G protein-coupled receptor 137B n=2 Tax=Homininae TaxID=207598 RepID=Q5TAF0_HUMAN|nr:G protein-coupled receptor 137B [Homo sapiens]KAI4085451.1 G protein-coupled receptor 137B [Homo sapiens]PNI55244.1 GPR137B isoform 1 [Pan troglodytes]
MRPERPRPRGSAPGPMETPPWDPARNDSLPPTLTPAVPPYVKLGLTVVYTVFYALLFVFIYVQLWLVLRYRHKRLSYQSVFLFLCLFWASLRTVLFSFYFKDFVAANSLSPFVFWLLYCFPVCLQFFTLTLMNLYFTQVAPLPGLPLHQPCFPVGEFNLCCAGKDGKLGEEGYRLCASGH